MKPERLNLWHLVSPGIFVPEIVNSIIKIPKGPKAKYELDKKSALIKLDSVFFSAVYYTANCGFIIQRYWRITIFWIFLPFFQLMSHFA